MYKFTILFITLLFGISFSAQVSYDDLQDQSGGIADGYGSWGDEEVIQEDPINVPGKGTITFYHPNTAVSQKPVVFFISGWGRPASSYWKLFHFIASQGYSVVNIFNTNPGDINNSYQYSMDMMIDAANNHFPEWIDTDRVGLMGHSYGAGSTIWLGKQLFSNPYNWGENGRFIFMSAPWYSLLVTPDDLINYPPNVKLVMEISDDDMASNPDLVWNTSEQAVRAVFELINIPSQNKEFIRVLSTDMSFEYDSDGNGNPETYTYDASHFVSYTGASSSGYKTWDALDVFAINRVSHALMDYVFEGNLEGKNVALGDGSSLQVNMGMLNDLEVDDTPVINKLDSECQYPCASNWNDFDTNENTWFLQSACDDSDNDGIIDILEEMGGLDLSLKVILEGAYDVDNGLMRDELRVANYLSVAEPYSSLGYEFVGGGDEISEPGIFSIIGNDAIVDWVVVELRDAENPANVVYSTAALLQRDGDIVSVNGAAVIHFEPLNVPSVLVAIRHRNHLGIRIENEINSSGQFTIDFTNPVTVIHGVAPVAIISGKQALYAGDANRDGQVGTVDKNDYWRVENSSGFSYPATKSDFNLDGTVNANDKNWYWQVNNSKQEQLD